MPYKKAATPGEGATAGNGYAVLAVPIWRFSKKEKVAIGHRLPFIPTS